MAIQKLTTIFKALQVLFLLLFVFLVGRAFYFMPSVDFEPLVRKEVFEKPLHITNYPLNSSVLLVTEKAGLIKWFEKGSDKVSGVLLDISDKVYSAGGEEGLLSLAFDPDFKSNGYFYVFYSLQHPYRSRVSRFKSEGLKADLNSELKIFEVNKFLTGHNGGDIQFGKDGNLWISIGESGAVGIGSKETLISRSTHHGTILRIDVSNSSEIEPYKIPADNPFINHEFIKPEVWANGLRNPWRFIFYGEGQLLIADVGSNDMEEINIVEKGKDYGWPVYEGQICIDKKKTRCEIFKDTTRPIIEMDNNNVLTAIIGGVLYDGKHLAHLKGQYIFADFMRGLFSIKIPTEPITIKDMPSKHLSWIYPKLPTQRGENSGRTRNISTMYLDPNDGEVYVADLNGDLGRLKELSVANYIKHFIYLMLSFR